MKGRSSAMQFALDESSSDDDDELILAITHQVHSEYQRRNTPLHGGSMPGRQEINRERVGGHAMPGRQEINRERVGGHARIYQDYFSENPTYSPTLFRHRFRMSTSLFLHIVHVVEAHDSYFVQKRNAAGQLGLSPLQKVTAAFIQLAYGVPADATDQYVRIGESTAVESLKKFVKAIIEIFGDEYLRSPNENDTARLLAIGEQGGFPGMLGSIDCMHWKCENCPSAWQGMYTGHMHKPTIILEAVASHDLWIWHAFFGLPGSHNDINVLDRSPLFAKLAEGQAPKVNYTINGHNYTMGYYLADGIYPTLATFVKSIPSPQGNKKKHFNKAQEANRKDVERAFGVLQSRFAIVRDQKTLGDIMTACVIMHNMIIEDEAGEEVDYHYDGFGKNVIPSHEPTLELEQFIENLKSIRSQHVHSQLQEDLVEHLCQSYGAE